MLRNTCIKLRQIVTSFKCQRKYRKLSKTRYMHIYHRLNKTIMETFEGSFVLGHLSVVVSPLSMWGPSRS